MFTEFIARTSAPRSRTAQELLTYAAPALLGEAGIRQIRIYRVARHGIVVWWASQARPEDARPYMLENLPLHAHAIEQQSPLLEGQTYVLPMGRDEGLFGLLELVFDSAPSPATLEQLQASLALFSARLEALQLSRLLEQQVSASSALNSCESYQEIASVLGQYIAQHGQFIAIGMFEYDAEQRLQGFRTVATANQHNSYVVDELTIPSGNALQRQYELLQDPGEFYVADVDTDPLVEPIRVWLKSLRVKSMYQSALRSAGKVYGFINWNDTQGSILLTPLETLIFTSLAEQASSVIETRRATQERDRYLQEVRLQAVRLQTINAFAQAIQAIQDLNSILASAVDYCRRLLEVDYIDLFGFERQTGRLHLYGSYANQDTHIYGEPGMAIVLDPESLVRQVWSTRNYICIQDLDKENVPHHFKGKMRSILTVLVAFSGQAYGVMEIGNRRPQVYGEAEIITAMQLVGQLAVSIANADVFRRTQQVAETKTLVNEISARIEQQTDVEGMVIAAARELGRALGAKRARVRLTSTLPASSLAGSSETER